MREFKLISLVLGGARSGKSGYAENLAESSGGKLVYLATAQARDEEMRRRIEHHQDNRSPLWELHEEPLRLARILERVSTDQTTVLVDCLTLWLSNLMHEGPGISKDFFQEQRIALLETLPGLPGDIILVSNEVGQGIVPMGELNRQFIDAAGWLHQDIVAVSDRVVFLTAGLPMVLKG